MRTLETLELTPAERMTLPHPVLPKTLGMKTTFQEDCALSVAVNICTNHPSSSIAKQAWIKAHP